jgi:hypothetical protein
VRRGLLFLAVLPFLSGATCGHELNEGPYAFSQDQLISDPCNIITNPGALATGTLTLIGNTLRVDDFEYAGITFQLLGTYEWNIESFYMDGSAGNVAVTASGLPCTVDLVTVDATAVTDDPTHFHGTLRVQYEAHTQTACQCKATLTYRAVEQ